jgi:c(7)-type cytochrome triheme protein
MKASMRGLILASLCAVALAAGSVSAGVFSLPDQPPYDQYGNVLMNRTSEAHGVSWVSFSHWSHRRSYTCRVCHLELEFAMEANATEITEKANRQGRYCGACHDGKTAFGHTADNCGTCHNGNISFGEEKFKDLASLPMARYGNRIDWSKALREGMISPRQSILNDSYAPIPFVKELRLEAEETNITPAVFSHREHTQWLDCANCHPQIFKIKKKTTENFSMDNILKGEFCGACHLTVAFPVNDCNRCHCAEE